MPKSRTMGAGLASSTRKGSRSNVRTIQIGNKLQGLPPTTNKKVEFVSNAIKTRSYCENRNVIFCMNQLGGVGAVSGGNNSRMFGSTSDGVKDCITGPYGCEQVVREAYLEVYGREPDKSGLRTYCLAMTKRKWSKADVIADLEKNPDLLAPIYASLAGDYQIEVYDGNGNLLLPEKTLEMRTLRPVNIDSLGNITGSPTIGKITVNNATAPLSQGSLSLTMDEYGVTNATGKKFKYSVGLLGNIPKIEACLMYFFQENPVRNIYFYKDSDKDGVDDVVDEFPNDPNETKDTDGDGVGDNADVFPNDPNKYKVTEPPVITINGEEEVTIEVSVDGTYVDAGATATDEVGANLDIVVTGTVDATQIGTYTITYTATDNYGFTSTATRTVNVVDTTAPVISLLGDNPLTIEVDVNGTYEDPGATAIDNSEESIEPYIQVNNVDITQVGEYSVGYAASDASGNTSVKVRTVKVVDTTSPIITLLGSNPLIIEVDVNGTYEDPGARATDNSGQIRAYHPYIYYDDVDITQAGEYSVEYEASDSYGNTSVKVRTVKVIPNIDQIYESFAGYYNLSVYLPCASRAAGDIGQAANRLLYKPYVISGSGESLEYAGTSVGRGAYVDYNVPVKIDKLGNITGRAGALSDFKLGKITITSALKYAGLGPASEGSPRFQREQATRLTMNPPGNIGITDIPLGVMVITVMDKITAIEYRFYTEDDCKEVQLVKDTDGDGEGDEYDEFPNDPTKT